VSEQHEGHLERDVAIISARPLVTHHGSTEDPEAVSLNIQGDAKAKNAHGEDAQDEHSSGTLLSGQEIHWNAWNASAWRHK